MSPTEIDTWLADPCRRPLVMGVLNVTPDSFSDGGQFSEPERALEHALAMAGEGADWIDVGGESTRPGAQPVPIEEQVRRTAPVIAAIRRKLEIVISIDTTRGAVAEAALGAGAGVVNDISAGRDDSAMFAVCVGHGAGIVLSHMQGTPATMQEAPAYDDVTAEVARFLMQRRDEAMRAGIDRKRILLDPGLGFGKTVSDNLRLLKDTGALAALGQPLVVGPSRKSFIGKVLGEARARERLFGTVGAVAWSVANGAAVTRVHDVGPIAQVVSMIRAISVGNT